MPSVSALLKDSFPNIAEKTGTERLKKLLFINLITIRDATAEKLSITLLLLIVSHAQSHESIAVNTFYANTKQNMTSLPVFAGDLNPILFGCKRVIDCWKGSTFHAAVLGCR